MTELVDRHERPLARRALEAWRIDEARLTLVRQAFNRTYRVLTPARRRHALRLSPPERIHVPDTEAVEAAWLRDLKADGFPVPGVSPTVAGATMAGVADRDGEPRTATLFEWLPGRPPRATLTVADARAFGRLAAELHDHGAAWSIPNGLQPVRSDHVLYWTLPNRLTSDVPGAGRLLGEALHRAQASIDRLWSAPGARPHMLHGDLHAGNILVGPAGVHVIDFQDLVLGLESQDLAIAVLMLRSHPEPAPLSQAFRAGYAEVRPWPLDDSVLEDLIAARLLNVLNLGLTLRRLGIDAFVRTFVAEIRAWMASGRTQ